MRAGDNVSVSLKGFHLFTGRVVANPSQLMFWNRVEVDPLFDMDMVKHRLSEIQATDGIHSETIGGSRVVDLAPIFKLNPIEVLA